MFAVYGLKFAKGCKENARKIYYRNFYNDQKFNKRLQNFKFLLTQCKMLD